MFISWHHVFLFFCFHFSHQDDCSCRIQGTRCQLLVKTFITVEFLLTIPWTKRDLVSSCGMSFSSCLFCTYPPYVDVLCVAS